ncbi:hypothetical protein QE152_g32285 [Popillia japonica]|uniref:Uncharacterized protein n=1 Tax=Popillia japonica TaxID=7064 RepID=A0AAW1IZT7_POPJA
MVSNEKVKEYFCEYLIYEPFTIQTAHATTRHDYTIDIPCLKTFKAPHERLKFHVFDFSENYDGLIGVNLMRQLGAVIDVPNGVLKTKFGEIKIYWENSTVNLGPRERKIVKIPVTKNCSNILINHQKLAPGVEMPSLITSAKDFYAIAEIANFNNHSIKVGIENPITAEIYETENNTKN